MRRGALALAVPCLIAACGSSSGSQHRASNPYGPSGSPVAMSRCMRAHGLTNFPDPSAGPGGEGFPGGVNAAAGSQDKTLTVDGLTFSGPAYVRAAAACRRYLPGGGGPPHHLPASRQRQLLAESSCMRAHGVPDFPDFRFPAGGGVMLTLPSNLDPASPSFQQAAGRCGLPGEAAVSKRRALAALTLVVAIAVVVAIILINRGSSPSGGAAASGSGGSSVATVQRRNLVATDTESGTLTYADPQTVYNRLSGTITWLPSAGRLVQPGQPLFRVEDEPVILMDGSTPAYRDLSPSDTAGPDILELNRNLVRLGFDPDGIVADDIWQPATSAGVEMFQGSLDEAETGILTLGQVAFLRGPQLVSAVDTTVGSAGGSSGGSAAGGSSAALDDPAPSPDYVSLAPQSFTVTSPTIHTTQSTSPTTTRQTKQSPSKIRPAPRPPDQTRSLEHELQEALSALRAEAAALKASRSGSGKAGKSGSSSSSHDSSSSSPNSSDSSNSSGSAGSSAQAILSTTSDRLVVTVNLPASSQREARVGAHVTVQLPNSSTVGGRITSVSRVAQSSSSDSGSGSGSGGGSGGSGGGSGGSGGGSSSTVPVTIALSRHVSPKGADQAAVSVEFAQSRARHVLSVPVTALIATSGTSYAVQEAAAPHSLLAVRTGLFAAGYVQISGPQVQAGLRLTDSQG